MPMQPCERCDILKRIGPMNCSGQIQQVTETQDEFGSPIETWVTLRGGGLHVKISVVGSGYVPAKN